MITEIISEMKPITKSDLVVKIGKYKIYRCTSCDEPEIRNDYKFCPFCGEKVVFKLF